LAPRAPAAHIPCFSDGIAGLTIPCFPLPLDLFCRGSTNPFLSAAWPTRSSPLVLPEPRLATGEPPPSKRRDGKDDEKKKPWGPARPPRNRRPARCAAQAATAAASSPLAGGAAAGSGGAAAPTAAAVDPPAGGHGPRASPPPPPAPGGPTLGGAGRDAVKLNRISHRLPTSFNKPHPSIETRL